MTYSLKRRIKIASYSNVFPDYPEFDYTSKEFKRALKYAGKALPESRVKALKAAFGKKGGEAFRFYKILCMRYILELGIGPAGKRGDLAKNFKRSLQPLLKRFKGDITATRMIRNLAVDLKPALAKVENNPGSKKNWSKVAQMFGSVFPEIAKAGEVRKMTTVKRNGKPVIDKKTNKPKKKEVIAERTYLNTKDVIIKGSKWVYFSKMKPSQIKNELLKDEAPDLYDVKVKMKADVAEVNEAIISFIESETEYTPKLEYVRALRRNVAVGEDESTRSFTVSNRSAYFEGRKGFSKNNKETIEFMGITFQPGKVSKKEGAKEKDMWGPSYTFNAEEWSRAQQEPDFSRLMKGRGHPLVVQESVEAFVYPADNTGPFGKEEWISDQMAAQRMETDLARTERVDEAEADDIVEHQRLKSLDSGLTADTMQAIEDSPQKEEFVSITDDPKLQSRITRIFPVKRAPEEFPYNGRQVIMKGRYRGLYLDDVVNSEGRLIEGRHFGYKVEIDEEGNKKRVKDADNDPLSKSPHMSIASDGRIYLRVPGNGTKDIRHILGMSSTDSGSFATSIAPPEYEVMRPGEPGYEGNSGGTFTIKYQKDRPATTIAGVKLIPGEKVIVTAEQMEILSKSKKFNSTLSGRPRTTVRETETANSRGYYFSPQHFGKIRDALGGAVSMSREVSDKLSRYFNDLAAAEKSTGLTFHLKNNTQETISLEKANIEIPPGESVTVTGFKDVKALRSDEDFRELASETLKDEEGNFIDENGDLIPLDENGNPSKTLTHIEVSESNLRAYGLQEIGGFKEESKDGRPMKLLTKQKQALAWLEANGDKGVLALDTGLGKTITSIAHMQKLLADGEGDTTDEEGNVTKGRFLYVAPPSLLGNLKKEALKFMTGGAAEELLVRLDVLKATGGGGFSTAVKKNKAKLERFISSDGKIKKEKVEVTFNPEKYIAIYFDEAHKYMTGTSTAFKAATSFEHPRKIALTASPVQGEPMDAFILASLTSGVKLHEKDGKADKGGARTAWIKKRSRFKKRYTKSVGGRVIGVTENPSDKLALATWVKRNLFYADKQEVARDGEFKLPDPIREDVSINMPPEMEAEYKKFSNEFRDTMRAAVAKFQDYEFISVKGNRTEVRILSRNEAGQLLDPKGNVLDEKDKDKAERLNPGISGATIGKTLEALISKNSKTMSGWKKGMRAQMKRLFQLLLHPEEVVPGMVKNPKIKESSDLVTKSFSKGGRSLLFTDDKKMVVKTAKELSKTVPGNGIHVACEPAAIRFFQGGKELKSWKVDIPEEIKKPKEKRAMESLLEKGYTSEDIQEAFNALTDLEIETMASEMSEEEAPRFIKKAKAISKEKRSILDEATMSDSFRKSGGLRGNYEHKLPWKSSAYRLYGPGDRGKNESGEENNRSYAKYEWQKFVLDNIVSPNKRFATCTLHGPSYAEGHNLQAFTSVIHLDRDTWSNENMKQRTARAWRQGQENKVQVTTLDFSFANPSDQLEKTLDEIRKSFNLLEGNLFAAIIKDSQETELGKEWFEMQQRSSEKMKLDRDSFELSVCPTLLAGLGD